MYFAKLSLTPDEDTTMLAVRLATEAGVSDLASLERVFADLRTRGLDKAEVLRLAPIYGSALGELVRARIGGAWGTGRLFGERIPGGLLVGAAQIKFWPWAEARARLEGRVVQPLEERIAALSGRATNQVAEAPPRLYTLRANEGYFDAGVTADGRQVLMAAFYPATFAIFFAADGTHVDYQERANAVHAPDEAALRAWQAELGFTPRTIRVHKFEVSEIGVGIDDLPWHMQEFVEDPDAQEDPVERDALARSLVKWVDSGSFVLYWGNDLWVDASGHVTSS
jgi:hypothetical protein